MEMLICNLYWECKGAPLSFEHGILAGIRSIQDLFKDLTQCQYKYILTSRLNQDVVENFFSCIRGLSSGPDTHPDRLQALQRARIRLLCTETDHIIPVSKPSVAAENLDSYVPIDTSFVTTGMATGNEDLLAVFEEFVEEENL